MTLQGLNTPQIGDQHRWLFNGKEASNEHGLGWQDFGARRYDAQIGRWLGVDAMAGKYYTWSPYSFGIDSPIRAIDPSGNIVLIFYSKSTSQLIVLDFDQFDKDLDTRFVSPSQYKTSFKKGEKRFNQILVINDVFSGGHYDSESGNLFFKTRPEELPIPNGDYNILDNSSSKKGSDWYKLDPMDSRPFNDTFDQNDVRNSDGDKRDAFRLHPDRNSWGCVTVCKKANNSAPLGWEVLSRIIENGHYWKVPDEKNYNPFAELRQFGYLKISGMTPKNDQEIIEDLEEQPDFDPLQIIYPTDR